MIMYNDLQLNKVKVGTWVSLLTTDIHRMKAPDAHHAFFFFALAFFPSDRGRGVTTNLLTFDFVLVL